MYPKNLEETLYLFGENGHSKDRRHFDQQYRRVGLRRRDAKTDARQQGTRRKQTSNVYGNGHTLPLCRYGRRHLRMTAAPYVDAVAGRNALEMVLAIYKSQKTGEPVRLPLSEFRKHRYGG